jgi:hypothetical protein
MHGREEVGGTTVTTPLGKYVAAVTPHPERKVQCMRGCILRSQPMRQGVRGDDDNSGSSK